MSESIRVDPTCATSTQMKLSSLFPNANETLSLAPPQAESLDHEELSSWLRLQFVIHPEVSRPIPPGPDRPGPARVVGS